MRPELPTGTVSFLFTDVEASTKLLHELGAEAYAEALAEHRRVVREACAGQGGAEVDTQGDAFFFAFATAPVAIAAAQAITDGLSRGQIRVRIGVHTGTPFLTAEGYVGPDVHRAARIAAAGHGGQVLVSSSTAALLDAELLDLGEHRFKDLQAAERVFQLRDGAFPRLRSLYQTNLPVPATPFLGRERELGEVTELLARDETRLLTLTGPGGTGKTRLALQASAEASENFEDGIWWVPLAPLREPTLLLPAVAQALDVKEEPGRALAETLGGALAGKRTLLLLDNAEHLLPDAAREITRLGSTPGPRLLVTSRERLQLQGEQVYSVPTLVESDGVELFLARARALEPSFEADGDVQELCARLDHLPLALELAAARTVLFSPEQLLARLSQRLDLLKSGRDADPRQQTLRTTIAWSYELLSELEQRLFRSLSVFAGGCNYDAAEALCEADPDTLQSLLDKSLLRRRDTEFGPRYWMLETIIEYAAESLDAMAESFALRRRHAEWCCELAERLVGVGPARTNDESFGAFPDDYGNVRGALAWTWSAGEDELGLRLGATCWRYWMLRGLFHDAVSWLGHAKPRIPAASTEVRLQACKTAGYVAFFVLGNTEEAEEFCRQALADAEELGAADEIAWIEEFLATFVWDSGDFERALEMQQRNLVSARESGDRFREARSLHMLGEVLRDLERFDEGEEALLAADAIYRELGPEFHLSSNTHSLADLALDRGDLELAVSRYRESLDSELRAGRKRDAAYCLAGLASVLAERGLDEEAATIWGVVCAAEEALGFRMLGAERRRYEARLARLDGTPAWAAGRDLMLEEAQAVAVTALD